MPPRERAFWGWTPPVRVLLTALAGSLSVGLAWISRGDRPRAVALPALVVDVNRVPMPVLEALPGLGPVLAGRIVEAREAAPFASLGDFDRRVKGIGPARIAALKPFLRFDLDQDPAPNP